MNPSGKMRRMNEEQNLKENWEKGVTLLSLRIILIFRGGGEELLVPFVLCCRSFWFCNIDFISYINPNQMHLTQSRLHTFAINYWLLFVDSLCNSNANNKLGLNNRQGFLMQMKNLLNKVQLRHVVSSVL